MFSLISAVLLLMVPSWKNEQNNLVPSSKKSREPLPPGRQGVLSNRTHKDRVMLLKVFAAWIFKNHPPLTLQVAVKCQTTFNRLLDDYGRQSYVEHRSLHDYSELVNGVVDFDRELKGRLRKAWDLAEVWRARHPVESHLAVPVVVFRAMMVVSISWGWYRWASLLGLAFTAMLRPSEFLRAVRRLLTLPNDMITDPPPPQEGRFLTCLGPEITLGPMPPSAGQDRRSNSHRTLAHYDGTSPTR